MSCECGVTPTWESERLESLLHSRATAVLSRDTSLAPLRLSLSYSDLSVLSHSAPTLEDIILPLVARWYGNVLQTHPVTGMWKLPEHACGEAVPPTHLSPGLPNTDFVIYVTAVNDPTNHFLARGAACAIDGSEEKYPLAGLLVYNAAFYRDLSREEEIAIAKHQFAHILAFSAVLFPFFPKEIAENLVVHINTTSYLYSPSLLAKASAVFSCNTLPGIPLENYPESATHWEKRIMRSDFMTAATSPDVLYSDLTFAIFEDSGWYEVDYRLTDVLRIGEELNCEFTNGDWDTAPKGWGLCTQGLEEACNPGLTHKAMCNAVNSTNVLIGTDEYMDSYPFFQPLVNGDCRGNGRFLTAHVPLAYGERVCPNCRCLTGTYISSSIETPAPVHSGCHEVHCGSSVATIILGSSTIDCPPAGGRVSAVPGFHGYIECPPFSSLCPLPCLNGCSANGDCVNGECKCLKGVFGVDCSGQCHFSCETCSQDGYECASCGPNAFISAGICICIPGYFYNATRGICVNCAPGCQECSEETSCTDCFYPALLVANTCECPPNTFLNHASSHCESCHFTCSNCQGPGESDCVECEGLRELAGQPPNYCKCEGDCGKCSGSCKKCKSAGSEMCLECFPHAHPSVTTFPSSCICDSGFFPQANTASCAPCDPSCLSCSGASRYSCTSCAPSKVLIALLYCADNCPYGHYPDSGSCKKNPGREDFRLEFSQPIVAEELRNRGVVLGERQGKDSYEPQAYYHQGFLFDGNNDFLSLPPNEIDQSPITLHHSHSIYLWIRPAQSLGLRCLLTKSTVKLCLVNGVLPSLELAVTKVSDPSVRRVLTVSGGNVQISRRWTQLSYRLLYRDGESIATLYVDQRVVAVNKAGDSIFEDLTFSSGFIVGANSDRNSDFYRGNIAELVIANSEQDLSSPSCACPSCTFAGLCLSECLANEYQASGCNPCLSSCAHGCIRGGDCRNNIDPLCAEFELFDRCRKCAPLAEELYGTCGCTKNAHFVNDSCTCLDGFSASGNNCIKCNKYFSPSEVSAYFDSSYQFLIIEFQRPVSRSGYQSCSELLMSTEGLGRGFECQWSSELLSVAIHLGVDFTIQGTVDLDFLNIVSTKGNCTYDAQPLVPTIEYRYPPPIVNAVLSVPANFSLVCQQPSDLVLDASLSSGGIHHSLSFRWSFSSDQPIPGLQQYDGFDSANSILRIPKWILSPTVLKVSVLVRNYLGSEGLTQAVINISEGPAFAVIVEGGGQIALKAAERRVISTRILDPCNSSRPRYYSWTLLSTSPSITISGFQPFWLDESDSSEFLIPANSLKPGVNYTFQVDVRDGVVSGTAVVDIIALHSPLYVTLDRADAEISVKEQFRVSAYGSSDPDNPAAILSYSWECFDGTEICTSPQGIAVVQSEFLPYLVISSEKMQIDRNWKIALTARNGEKMTVRAINVHIKESSVATFYSVFSSALSLSIQTEVQSSMPLSLQWHQSSGPTLHFLTPLSHASVLIDPASVQPGLQYSLVLTAWAGGDSTRAFLTVATNLKPIGGSVTVSPSVGFAIDTEFSLISTDWVDPDCDYPLWYRWTYAYRGHQIPLSAKSLSSQRVFKSPAGQFVFTARVIDAVGSEATVKLEPLIVSSQGLQDRDVEAEFLAGAREAGRVGEMVIAFAYMFQFTETVMKTVISRLDSVVRSKKWLDTDEVDVYISSVEALLSQSIAQTFPLLKNLVGLLSWIVSHGDVEMRQAAYISEILGSIRPKSEEEVRKVAEFIGELAKSVVDSFYPDQEAVVLTAQDFFHWTQRYSQALFPDTQITHPLLRVRIPSSILTSLPISSSTALDFHASVLPLANSTSDEVTLSLYASGQWSNYRFLPDPQPSEVVVRGLIAPVVFSMHFRGLGNASYECQYINETGQWDSTGLNLTRIYDGYAECSALHFSTFRVAQTTLQAMIEVNPVPSGNGNSCSVNYAPLAIQCGMLLTAVVSVLCLLMIDRRAEKVQPPTPHFDFEAEAIADKPSPRCHTHEFVFTESSVVPPVVPKSSFSELAKDSHCVTCLCSPAKEMKRWMKAAPPLIALLVEMMTVGLMYRGSAFQTMETGSVFAFWEWYNVNDFLYTVIGLAVGILVEGAVLMLFTISGRRSAEVWPAAAGSLVAIVSSLSSVSVGAWVSSCLCFQAGGRWAIAAVPIIMGEVCINQAILSVARAVALQVLC